MLKLNASYSKKVPADAQYSSQSYHASIEVELSDGLSPEELQARIHETFQLVRDSVEAELHGNDQVPAHDRHTSAPTTDWPAQPASPHTGNGAATGKQINYLKALAARRGIDIGKLEDQVRTEYGVDDIHSITRKQASDLIEQFNSSRRAA